MRHQGQDGVADFLHGRRRKEREAGAIRSVAQLTPAPVNHQSGQSRVRSLDAWALILQIEHDDPVILNNTAVPGAQISVQLDVIP